MSETVWLEILALTGVIAKGLFDFIDKRIEKKKDALGKISEKLETVKTRVDADCEGTKILLADKLKYLCERALKEDEITLKDLRIIDELYKSYHGLGGNGFMTDIYEKVKKLKVKVE